MTKSNTELFGYERREDVRIEISTSVYLVLPHSEKEGKRKLRRFETLNVSRSGFLIESGTFPFRKLEHVEVVLLFPVIDNVSRFYFMDAYVRHTGNGKTGFSMMKKC